jgi:phenylacetate-CoA ligase
MEQFLRAQDARLLGIYDQMPHPVRNLLTSVRGWFLTRNRYKPEMYALHKELRSHEAWNSEQIAAYQLECLKQTVEHARKTVPFYANYPQMDWEGIKDLECFPVLSRDVVRERSIDFISKATRRRQQIQVRTTGTTGASLKVTYSALVSRRNWAFRMRQWSWAGVEPRHPRLTLFGSRVVPPTHAIPPYWTYNVMEHQILMSIFHLSENASPHYIAFLRRHSNKVLEGFPSVLGILADFILQKGDPIPMRVVFTEGEPLHPFLREKIEKAFQTKVYDSYGTTEWCGMIQGCEHRHMHLIPEYGFL